MNAPAVREPIDHVVARHRDEKWENISPDRRAFALAYVETLSHTKAAATIGRPGEGMKFFRDPEVLALIADLQEETYRYSVVTENFVQAQLLALLPKLLGEEEIPIVLANGETLRAKKFHAAEARATVNALGESLKRVNGTQINVDVTNTERREVSIENVQELYALIKAGEEESTPAMSHGDVIEGDYEQ